MYEVFDHTADVGLRIRAGSVAEVFSEAARGLFSLLVANLNEVRPVQEQTYQLEADQYDLLLFDWLTELLYTFESQKLLLASFDVRIDAHRLSAVCRGEPMDFERHQMEHEVKAITYHELKFEQADGGWLAEVIVDI